MALGDLLITDGMVELRGVAMGGSTDYQMIDWSPWAGADILSNTAPALTGVRSGLDTTGARTWVQRCWVTGTSEADMEANLLALQYAWRPGETVEIAWRSGGVKYMRYGRAMGAFTENAYKYPTELRFRCDDPYTYSCTEHSDLTVSGLTFPTDLVGNRASQAWRMIVAGPCTGPRLRFNAAQPDGDTQYNLDFPTLTIPAAYKLFVDAHEGSVLLVADSTGAATSQRAKAREGTSGGIADLLAMSADPFWWFDSDSGTMTCAMYWRDCWQ